MSDIEREAFESYVFGYDTLSDGWQDKGVDDHFIAGFRAGQAAREHEGGQAVAEVGVLNMGGGGTLKWRGIGSSDALPEGLEPGAKLYTHPPQSRGVPEGLSLPEVGARHPEVVRWRNNAIEASAKIAAAYGYEGVAEDIRKLLSTPAAPQVDKGVRCADRLPTEVDADCFGKVWASISTGEWVWIPYKAVVEAHCKNSLWQPTGLTRPQPPEQGEE